MIQQYFHRGNLSFKDKFFALDFLLIFLILLLGIISLFAMYSTEQGNFGYYTKSHLYRFVAFFIVFIFFSFLNTNFYSRTAYPFYLLVLVLLSLPQTQNDGLVYIFLIFNHQN